MKKKFILLSVFCLIAITLLVSQSYTSSVKMSTPSSDFIDNKDGTVSHKKTNLMWKVTSEGQTWEDGKVKGRCIDLSWKDVLNRIIEVNSGGIGENYGYSDWRVPTIEELKSITEKAAMDPAINLAIFPETPSVSFWSSTPKSGHFEYAWVLYFYNGYDYYYYVTDKTYFVRLVRNIDQ